MVIVNYRSKRELKKAVGKPLDYVDDLNSASMIVQNDEPYFVTNINNTFKATVTIVSGKIISVR
ncbi:hypothetical protein LCGC14_1484090 [marine sediment metagenome]|uniref:Uncharacterized protein n=1 Tax=marine sediment metagenome TaxID=412755 RepID=A0A0F9JUI0_9ZZZZ